MTKYHAKKTRLDGFVFDSLSEAHRYAELKLAERMGEIHWLRVHPRYPIEVNGHKVCTYIGDFAYTDKDGAEIVEDVKSAVTRKLPTYRLKRKLVRAVYGIDILETGKAG